MRATHDWHQTRLGRVVLFLGGIRFAVPVLLLVAAALAWGTYLESMHDSRVSRATVYGSWWFIALMGLIAVSLVFAVVSRYPWQRRHVGFITVHAGLLMLIAGGFWSLYGRLEGHLVLEEGQTGNILETDREVLEIAEFNAGQSTILGTIDAPTRPGTVTVGGVTLRVREYWDNSGEERYVADGGDRVLRAVEVSLEPGATSGEWIAQESRGAPPEMLGGLRIRVLADGEAWSPPAASGEEPPYFFVVGSDRHALSDPGEEAFPGWTVVSVERFAHAMVSGGKITESGQGDSNPAVTVTISDGQGTTERHTAFQKFPDLVLAKSVEGTGSSGARLAASAARVEGEQLVVFGPVGAMRLGYLGADGAGRELPGPITLPAALDLGGRKVSLLREFSRAHVATRPVPAPKSSQRRPALVIELPGAEGTEVVAYKSMTPVFAGGRNLLLRYGPMVHELPFAFTLRDFRKQDYPGTEMAMAYESDVTVSLPGREPFPYLVHMNTPFVSHPWKVYQSGFMGETVSIFSVMRDPGLPLTYIASIVLCVGIYLTFFSKTFSRGHPGIPTAFSRKTRNPNVAHHSNRADRPAASEPEPACAGVGGGSVAG